MAKGPWLSNVSLNKYIKCISYLEVQCGVCWYAEDLTSVDLRKYATLNQFQDQMSILSQHTLSRSKQDGKTILIGLEANSSIGNGSVTQHQGESLCLSQCLWWPHAWFTLGPSDLDLLAFPFLWTFPDPLFLLTSEAALLTSCDSDKKQAILGVGLSPLWFSICKMQVSEDRRHSYL